MEELQPTFQRGELNVLEGFLGCWREYSCMKILVKNGLEILAERDEYDQRPVNRLS